MAAGRYAKTRFGLEVTMFSKEYGVTIRQIADGCGVRYNTLLQVMVGRTAGLRAVPAVEGYIERHKAAHGPNRAGMTYAELYGPGRQGGGEKINRANVQK